MEAAGCKKTRWRTCEADPEVGRQRPREGVREEDERRRQEAQAEAEEAGVFVVGWDGPDETDDRRD